MEKAAADNDWEVAHGTADDLLIEALLEITRYTVHVNNVTRLLAHYANVGKWYA